MPEEKIVDGIHKLGDILKSVHEEIGQAFCYELDL
jgi:hypothetical protein